MKTVTSVCLILILVICPFTFGTELCNIPTAIGQRLQIGIFKTINDTGLGPCADECWTRTDCQSFNFHKYNGKCELSSDTAAANSGQVINTDGFVQSDISLWSQTLTGACATVSCPPKHKCTELASGNTVCLVTECPVAPSVANAQTTSSERGVNTIATYTCLNGLTMTGTPTVQCRADGKWTLVSFSCSASDCGNPPVVNFATVGAGEILVGSVRSYTCDTGYSSSNANQMTVTCQSDGTWSSVSFTCTSTAGCTGTVYDGRCYTMSTQALNWDSAKADCVTKNEKLVDIATDAENTAVKNMVIAAGQNTWIGGSDAVTEGTWVWTDGTPFSFTDWYVSDPDGGTSQNCVGFWTSLQNTWIDVGCTSSLYYICESI